MGEGGDRKVQDGGDICIYIADSLCCTSESDRHTNNKMPRLCLHVCFHYSFYLYNCQMKNKSVWLVDHKQSHQSHADDVYPNLEAYFKIK